ncbi:MAG: response regulator transcription factor [Planctomycetes bacterium]|nr:response regulator transcription factor [Planctomycetota bacterium]
MKIKTLIVDDHEIVRQAIAALLESEHGIEVVGEAQDGRKAVELAGLLKPDVVVMDITMPNLNGIEATRQIVREMPDTKIVALSAHCDRRSVREMLKAGASGYVPKNSAFEELICAIRNVAAGKNYLSPNVSKIVMEEYIQQSDLGEDASVYSVLTAREREVLQLISEGKSTKIIAKELHLSTKTIEWHRSHLMSKLNVQSVAELVKYAIREGLTCVEV